MLTVLPALALGTVGVLITIMFGLKEEVRELEFPVLYPYEKASKTPFQYMHDTKYRPHSGMYASLHLQEIAKAYPEDFKDGSDDLGMGLYGDITLRLVFDSLIQIFPLNWDVKISQINLPFVNQRSFGPNSNVQQQRSFHGRRLRPYFRNHMHSRRPLSLLES
jgi:hypothetical protein